MNILEFFDYVYYRIYMIYCKYESERDSAGFTSALALSFLQVLNLVTISFIVLISLDNFVLLTKIPKPYLVLISLIIFGINWLRYLRKDKTYKLVKKWRNETDEVKKKKWIYVILYISLSFAILIIVAFANGGVDKELLNN